ncbi:MAG: hypothetical protein PHW31_01885 [Candidatus Pacebacteria bacterium]|nr:hypothetical protein [Candidatus Paceibacterota bacterium]
MQTKIKVFLKPILAVAVLSLIFFFLPAEANPAIVFTHPAGDISQDSATIAGELTDLGGKSSAVVWFEYGLTADYGSKTNNQTLINIGAFQAKIDDLKSCTVYHYRAASDNGSSIVYGIDRNFITQCTTNELKVTLQAIPYSGLAPLSNVSLKADVSGGQAGDVHYWFDCVNDGSWDKEVTIYQGTNSSYTTEGLCNYPSNGVYTAKVMVARLGLSAQNTTIITVGNNQPVIPAGGQYTLSVQKTVQDLTSGTAFLDNVSANFGDELVYKIVITSSGQVTAPSVYLKDTLPSGIVYLGGLTVNGAEDNRDLTNSLFLGDIPVGASKTITYHAKVNSKNYFGNVAQSLVNTALVYNGGLSITDTAKVSIGGGTGVAASIATDVNTGITDTLFNSLLLPLGLAALLIFLFKSQLLGFDKWATVRKEQTDGFRAQQKLKRLIKKRK